MKPLAIVPTYVTTPYDVDVTQVCIESMRKTVGDACDLLVIDDGSPDRELVEALTGLIERHDGEIVAKEQNQGFSRTVNIGLRRALQQGRDAVLVNADIEFTTETWLKLMVAQRAEDGDRLASIVGALLFYPNGLIQHAGVFFSLLYREFDHIFRYAPRDLPEARDSRSVPVTGALQFIRLECLEGIGVYDEQFRMGFEDVDYCIRVHNSGRSIVYQPGVQAIHHESLFRGRKSKKLDDWHALSWQYFTQKWSQQSMAEFVPFFAS